MLIGGIVLVALIAGVFIYWQTGQSVSAPLSEEQRAVLLKRFETYDKAEKITPLKREISPEKPVNVITYYGNDDIKALWGLVPEDIQEISVLLIIPPNTMMPGASTAMLQEAARTCEENGIPFLIQIANGETHKEWMLPLQYVKEQFADMEWFYGLSMAEIYNGEEWRGEINGDHALYVADIIEFCSDYGVFFFWTDTNIFGDNGMIIDWIEENEFLYTTMKDNYEHIIMQNKESYGDASTYSLMKGLYMSKLIGGWGVATDWWHWQVSQYKSLFGENDKNIDNEWERIYYYPEAMQTQSMMFVMSSGGFAFKNEAQFYSVGLEGRRTATFEYLTIPFLREILSGRFEIPTREDLLKETKAAIVGGENYSALGYDTKISTLYPIVPDYGIVPLLPSNLRLEERQIFIDNDIVLIDDDVSPKSMKGLVYNSFQGNSFLGYGRNQWFFLNSSENKNERRYVEVAETGYDSVSDFRIESDPHTFVMLKAEEEGMVIHTNNLRLSKKTMLDTLDGTESPGEALSEWITVDEENPYPKAGFEEGRKTVFELKLVEGTEKPVIQVENNVYEERPAEIEEIYNSDSNIYRLEITHNGSVNLKLGLKGYSGIFTGDDKASVASQESNPGEKEYEEDDEVAIILTKLKSKVEAMAPLQEKANMYTETSYHYFLRAFSKAELALNEGIFKEEQLEEVLEELEKSHSMLLDLTKYVDLLRASKIYLNTEAEADFYEAYDSLLRECLAPGLYYNGKDNDLRFRFYRKENEYDLKLMSQKLQALEGAYERLKHEFGGIQDQ